MQDKDKQQVIKAIGELGRRVTTADVATKTGLPVLTVQQKLNQVALEAGGHMQVGQSGDIVYRFAPGFSNTYIAKGLAAVLAVALAKIGSVLFYLVRISFGVALILSLLTIIVLILFMAIVMSQGARGGRDDDSGDFGLGGLGDWNLHFSFWDWMVLRDLLFWDSITRRPVYYDYSRPTIRKRQRSSFLLNCFSFLFGDGDPNEGLEEKRWQLIAQVIKKNKNVVTAEQLAPYTGAAPTDQDAVLPVLVRFNGRPEVTASGNIVYVFESMGSIAVDQSVNPPAYLQEFPWKFTNVPEGELLPVFVVAILNVAGAWTLWRWFGAAGHLAGGIMPLINVLCAYGTLFCAIPMVRWVFNVIRNKKIDTRNIQRFRYARMLSMPDEELKKKLGEASTYRIADRKISEKDIVYTTEKDALDQPDELSDKFSAMENQGSFDASPGSSQDEGQVIEDKGNVIDIRKRHKEFDASP